MHWDACMVPLSSSFSSSSSSSSCSSYSSYLLLLLFSPAPFPPPVLFLLLAILFLLLLCLLLLNKGKEEELVLELIAFLLQTIPLLHSFASWLYIFSLKVKKWIWQVDCVRWGELGYWRAYCDLLSFLSSFFPSLLLLPYFLSFFPLSCPSYWTSLSTF